MAKRLIDRPRNSGNWSEAQYVAFIKSALRGARWPPKYEVIKRAKVGYALYRCAICGGIGPPTLPPKEGNKNRIKNIVADHIDPVVDPSVGFVDWNTFIARLFVEVDGFQAVCNSCHTVKTQEENQMRRETREDKDIGTE